jgi:hypothetical protein
MRQNSAYTTLRYPPRTSWTHSIALNRFVRLIRLPRGFLSRLRYPGKDRQPTSSVWGSLFPVPYAWVPDWYACCRALIAINRKSAHWRQGTYMRERRSSLTQKPFSFTELKDDLFGGISFSWSLTHLLSLLLTLHLDQCLGRVNLGFMMRTLETLIE